MCSFWASVLHSHDMSTHRAEVLNQHLWSFNKLSLINKMMLKICSIPHFNTNDWFSSLDWIHGGYARSTQIFQSSRRYVIQKCMCKHLNRDLETLFWTFCTDNFKWENIFCPQLVRCSLSCLLSPLSNGWKEEGGKEGDQTKTWMDRLKSQPEPGGRPMLDHKDTEEEEDNRWMKRGLRRKKNTSSDVINKDPLQDWCLVGIQSLLLHLLADKAIKNGNSTPECLYCKRFYFNWLLSMYRRTICT